MGTLRTGRRLLLELTTPIPRSVTRRHHARLLQTEAATLVSLQRRPGKKQPIGNAARQLDRHLQSRSVHSPPQPDSHAYHEPNKARNQDILEEFKQHVASNLAHATGSPLHAETFYRELRTSKTPRNGDLHLSMRAVPFLNQPDNSTLSLSWLARWPESDLVEKPALKDDRLHFFFKPRPLVERVMSQALAQGEAYGFDTSMGLTTDGQRRKRMVIDFSSPNIAKPFHAGHLRSTLCGAFLANLYEKQGWEVVRINYLGDWGTQFGLLAVGFKTYGNEEKLKQDPIGHLYEVYVKINLDNEAEKEAAPVASSRNSPTAQGTVHQRALRFFRKMEDGDADALDVWRRFREVSIEKYRQTYQKLNISFDKYGGESEVDRSQIANIVAKLKATGHVREDGGALILDIPDPPGYALLEKRDGTSVYLTRDMAEAIARYKEYRFDRMLYVVGAEQTRYFQDLFNGLKLLGEGELAEKCVHVPLGRVKGMSTRRGTAVFLNDILEDASKRMFEVITESPEKMREVEDPQKVADALGISALAVEDMKSRRVLGYKFDLERMANFIGDTGPYLQYTHTRLYSIRRRAAIDPAHFVSADFSALKEESALQIVRILLRWPAVLKEAMDASDAAESAPVVNYLLQLAHLVNGSYRKLRVLGVEPEVQLARMALYEAARQTLAGGLKLLGLTPLHRM